jgi:tetratricopeptide (TPR) repeat protein
VFETLEQALACHVQGRLPEAEQLYRCVIETDECHFGAVHGLGLVHLQQGRFADAMDLFRRAIKIDRSSAEAHHHVGVALIGLGRPEEAIERFKRALAIRPDLAEAHDSLGHALQLLGKYERAIAHHQSAIAVKPTYAEAHNNLGNALHRLGRSEKAIRQYEKAIAIQPNYAEAHNNFGRALTALGRHDDAVAHYESALAIRPDYIDVHINLGNALQELDRHEEAIAHYDAVLAVRPDNFDVLIKRGHILKGLGLYDNAIAEYAKALEIRPEDAEALTERGHALITVGRYVEAAELFTRLGKTESNPADVLVALSSLPASLVSAEMMMQLSEKMQLEGVDKTNFEHIAGFVRASALDRLGRQAEAWKQLVPANRARFLAGQEEFREDLAIERTSLERIKAKEPKTATARIDHRYPVLLFILGPSRSGKSTMEALVSTLPGVKRGYENFSLSRAVQRALRSSGLPDGTGSLERLPATLYPVCHATYIDELVKRTGCARAYTETHPGHIREADLVVDAFPNVRFIFVKRNIEDNLLRMYQRVYKRGHVYAYDLKAARDHIVWYHRMMDLLHERIPEIVRIVHYEDLVADPAAAVRAAAELCGLAMTSAPLPPVGDDRGCATPYLQFMAPELER